MGAAYFYHLTQKPLEKALPILLEKAMQAGWRIEVRGNDEQRLAWLDEQLWLGPSDSFLPHGLAGGVQDALQPILLSLKPTSQANCIISVDGALIDENEVEVSERICILFNGLDVEQLNGARQQWKSLTEAGCQAQYWSDESGRWQKKAEKNAPNC
ncbi:MAG: DNA polymerase III subunit chi [Aestuariivita sp.]|nr:DNA polymerase III subunit chi [Aestuariivita sp.]